jgi:hypothetical protein
VKGRYEPKCIVDRNLGSIIRETFHVNQAPGFIDNIPGIRESLNKTMKTQIREQVSDCILQSMKRHGNDHNILMRGYAFQQHAIA